MVKISLFGNPGTGTSSTGKALAKKLNFDFISSGNMFRELATKLGFEFYEFSELCKTNIEYDKKLDIEIKNYGLNNEDFVIDSRLAWYFIKDSIKIKLDCEFDKRIKRISDRDGVDFDFAKNKTIKREELERERYFNLYKIAGLDSNQNFDLIIDTTNLTIDKTVEIIINYLKEKNYI